MDRHKIIIKNSVIIVSDKVFTAAGEDAAFKESIKSFDIASKTPVEAFNFLRVLKNMFK